MAGVPPLLTPQILSLMALCLQGEIAALIPVELESLKGLSLMLEFFLDSLRLWPPRLKRAGEVTLTPGLSGMRFAALDCSHSLGVVPRTAR